MDIKIYGADWCRDCIFVKRFLDEKDIPYEYIDITKNEKEIIFVENHNQGKRVIPTIIIEGKVYSNPGIMELTRIIAE